LWAALWFQEEMALKIEKCKLKIGNYKSNYGRTGYGVTGNFQFSVCNFQFAI